MHMFYEDIQAKLQIPVLHIAAATGEKIKEKEIRKVGLLATKYTMDLDFYANKLKQLGIESVTPNETDRKIINDVIYDELVKGEILKTSKEKYLQITE